MAEWDDKSFQPVWNMFKNLLSVSILVIVFTYNVAEFFSVCPLQLLREIETKVWLLAVESETQVKSEGDFNFTFSTRESGIKNDPSIIDRTASIIAKMDRH